MTSRDPGEEREANGRRLLSLARAEGFDLAHVVPAAPQLQAREAARSALEGGHLAGMEWITAGWLERATDPGAFLPGAQSALLVALPCHAPDPLVPVDGVSRGRVARYARGRDYHRTFEARLRRIARQVRDEPGAGARATVDYGPLLERPLAATAAMGWLGRSTMLLVPGIGPWVLLGAVVTTLAVEPARPLQKTCGSCRRCVVACPTGALGTDGGLLDARLCISYHTIENRGPIPRNLRSKFGAWVFGCDDCLDSCPVGTRREESHPDFVPPDADAAFPPLAELLSLDEAAFAARFRGRAIMRAKRDGLVRNACVALGNVGHADEVPALLGALCDRSPLVRGHAAWALAELTLRLRIDPGQARAELEERLASETDPGVAEELAYARARLA